MSLFRKRKKTRPGLLFGLALGLVLMSSMARPQAPPGGLPPLPMPPGNPGPARPAHPLDQPLQWLQEARKLHAGHRDYVCTLIKQERIQGRLNEQNVVLMKIRTQPFSVNMRWLLPREMAGQEVSFIYGRNGNKMRVNSAKGIKRVVGFVSVDPNDRRVFEQSRHNIYEAGIGSLIDQTIRHWDLDRKINKTQVRIAEYTYNKRRCYRVETIQLEKNPQFYSYRGVLYLDKETKLPIRAENYDWPRPGGPPGGELLESFSFVDLRFNVGLTDADFVR